MPQTGRLSTRTMAAAGALLFLAAFAFYLHASPASLYLDDSGETVTVAALLGIGHPPGYPLHTLLARLFTLLPWSSPIWRVNVLGCLAAAATLTLLAAASLRVLSRRFPIPLAAAAAGAAVAYLALGPVFWHNALGAKGSIYQLNNLLSVALLALLAGPDAPGRKAGRAFWLLLGLALAHHYMSQAVLLPAYAWLLWRRRGDVRLRDAWLALPGLALYLYFPVRWAQHPGLSWGDFGGWDDFWFYFLRLQYAAGEVARSAGTSLGQARHALGLMGREGAVVLSVLALGALWAGRTQARVQALGLGCLGVLLAVTFYLNLSGDRLDIMQPYLFPAYLCQAWLAAEGLAWAAERGGPVLARLLPAAALAGALLLGSVRWPVLNLRGYHYALDNARGLLLNLPRNALLLAQGDAVIFPLWYLQRVLHERDDVAVVGLAVLPMDWVRRDLARMHPDLRHPSVKGPIGAESVPALTQAYLELNPQRPRYAAFNHFDKPLPGWSLRGEGQAWKAVQGAPEPPPPAQSLARLDASSLRGFTRRPLDARTLKLIVGDRAIAANSLGVQAEDAGDFPGALDCYRQARRLRPEDPDYTFNIGNAYHALKRPDLALKAYAEAVALDPRYQPGWYNLGVVHFERGERTEAQAAFRQVLALDPTRNDVRQILAGLGD